MGKSCEEYKPDGRYCHEGPVAHDSARLERFIHASTLRPRGAYFQISVENRWDEKAGLRRDAVRSQVIDVLLAQEIKETDNEKG
jgi:hypothetical protein